MAESANSGITGLAFIVGALFVAVLVVGYFAFGGTVDTGGGKDIDVKIEALAPAQGGKSQQDLSRQFAASVCL
jgi:hypothetical protein